MGAWAGGVWGAWAVVDGAGAKIGRVLAGGWAVGAVAAGG